MKEQFKHVYTGDEAKTTPERIFEERTGNTPEVGKKSIFSKALGGGNKI
jgi:hypothetical protein